MVTETAHGNGSSTTDVLERPSGNGHSTANTGRSRPPAEIERARRSAAFTRQVIGNPDMIREIALRALKDSGGNGPQMTQLFGRLVEEQAGVRFAVPAVRSMLMRCEEFGILSFRKVGTAYHWSEGNGRRTRRASARKAVKLPDVTKPGRPKKLQADDAAERLIAGLSQALEAAYELRDELHTLATVKEQMAQMVRALRTR